MRLSVIQLTEACGVSRKTFYYHFSDLAKLTQWFFRYEMDRELAAKCFQNSLVFPSPNREDPYPEFAFYARTGSGVRSLDCSAFFEILSDYLEQNRRYYWYILNNSGGAGFMRYIIKLYQAAIVDDIHIILGGRQLPVNETHQLSKYFLYSAVVSRFSEIAYSQKSVKLTLPGSLKNMVHNNLYSAIECYFDSLRNEHLSVIGATSYRQHT
ncbi:hypothetical protein FACS1894104_0760 [Actinomycetota bacterium]|nr:hypothetical protein FACS1894104_0760 [Actinomycetota bacterium]